MKTSPALRLASMVRFMAKEARSFAGDRGGNFMLLAALILVPLVLFAGGAVDLADASHKRSAIQSAADIAALGAASMADATFGDRETRAHQLFHQNMSGTDDELTGRLSAENGVFTYTVADEVPYRFMKIVGLDKAKLNVVAQAATQGPDIDIAFVLDNSGSMKGERIRELKGAVRLFLDEFKDQRDRIRVALVPFHSGVRLSDANLARSETDLEFIDCRLLESGTGWDSFYGPLCSSGRPGFVIGSTGAYVTADGSKDAFLYKAVTASGRNAIRADRATCIDSVYRRRGDQCMNYKVSQVSNFVVYDQPSKQSCVIDRNQNFDVTSDAPDRAGRKYPTSQCDTQEIGEVRPLDGNLDLVASRVDALTAEGSTNLTIGIQWGMEALSPTSPLTGRRSGAEPVMVILSDGKNQKNRWHFLTGDTTPIDDRTRAACQHAKTRAEPINVYAVNLIDGDPAVLRGCASRPEQYYAIASAGELRSVFARIAGEIKGVRLVK
ncbi:VWA domain-containing protein [Fulvimarina endophytica]|nr:VWA domain-containing protein [Fulvimarina endophytica]